MSIVQNQGYDAAVPVQNSINCLRRPRLSTSPFTYRKKVITFLLDKSTKFGMELP